MYPPPRRPASAPPDRALARTAPAVPRALASLTLATLALAALLAAWAAPARADALDDSRFIGQCVESHLSKGTAAAEAACLGLIALPCASAPQEAAVDQTATEAREAVESACLAREHAAWKSQMDEWWPALLASAVSLDARDDRQSASSDALRRAQRAWESFAEAECGYAYALWGRSDFRNVARADCEMRTLARRAIQLRAQTGLD
ncbi:MAG: lysozyme inhibitor LprI family protein [Pseudomonadota bacterium]|nr:lysozyme inhibitor LprI family protein [Pseudomonadota bacterium]MEE3098145.1 lysozyme inhibitor LprI family protein [Pseudomonadota bacterium]